MPSSRRISVALRLVALGWLPWHGLRAHTETAPTTAQEQRVADASRLATAPENARAAAGSLHVRWQNENGSRPIGGLVRITLQGSREAAPLSGLFERPGGWFSAPADSVVRLPPGRYQVEGTRGTDSSIVTESVDVGSTAEITVTLSPARFYDPTGRDLRATNTHLHLLVKSRLKMGVDLADRAQADAYLQTIGATDQLDLVYVSYLTQPELDVLSNHYTADDLRAFSSGPTLFADGIEHRHGGVRVLVDPPPASATGGKPVYTQDNSSVAMSYGHVLLLGLERHRVSASVGPGLAGVAGATDGVPLRDGMREARAEHSGVVWCHGSQGLEWIPSWVGGVLDAQNIYDGGNEGTVETVHYPLLNAGLRIPFSAGSDWGVWDFSRVYVTTKGPVTNDSFLRELTAGRTYITNEPFLEFTADQATAGDTVQLAAAGKMRVRGRAVGRSDFIRLQVVRNGNVVHEMPSRPVAQHFEADIDLELPVAESGWLALRVPPEMPYTIRSRYEGRGVNIFGKAIFAHTSPVYVTVAGRPRHDRAAVTQLIERVDGALATIDKVGYFRD